MKDHNLTPREQAALEDFVRKDLSGGAAPKTPAAADLHDLNADLKEKKAQQSGVLNTVAPHLDEGSRKQDIQVNQQVADDALDVEMFARGDVDRVVEELRNKKAEDQRRLQAHKAGLPFVRLLGYPISPDVLALVPRELARTRGIIAYLKAGQKVRLGVTDPGNPATQQAVEALKRNTTFDFLVAVIGDDSYRYAMKLYEELPEDRTATDSVAIAGRAKTKNAFDRDIKSLLELKERIKGVPTTKLIDTLMTGAVRVGASDIHLEPMDGKIRVRYRLDGVLQTVADFPGEVGHAMLSRLKFLAKLKLDVNHLPQDGRFTVKDENKGQLVEIDIRVATVPSQYGEAVTMRLLDRDKLNLTIDSLGLTGDGLTKVREACKKPQGLILECGPTGSGKTTTLYALLSQLNDPAKKVITLEDPVEYRLPGILQSQVEADKGYDFAQGFRSVLRLDPDVVMVGEIRDEETAEMGIQASLTGHIVLSTLHTNDAPTAIPRLIDLGVRPFLLSNAINVVVAQRLVRQVCNKCAAERPLDQVAMAALRQRLEALPKAAREALPPEKEWLFVEGKGCHECNGTGFRGRIGIFEVLVPNEQIEQLAIKRAAVSEIKQAAIASGMITMEQDGLIKALTGVTTVAEVWRVARDI